MSKPAALTHTVLAAAAAAMSLTGGLAAPAVAAAQVSAPSGSQGAYQRQDEARYRDYERRRQQWERENCVRKRNSDTVAGALIGGTLGAIIGSQLGERGSRTGAGIAGGAIGAVAGGAIANSSSGACPPGYDYAAREADYGPPAPPPPPPPPAGYEDPDAVYEGPAYDYGAPTYYYGPGWGFWYGSRWRGGAGFWRRW